VPLFLRCLLFACILLAGAASASVDDTFLAARDAYGRGKMDTFSHLSAKVPASYPLRVYLDYWQIKSRSASSDELAKFAADHSDSPLSERVLQDLARFYGKNEDWPAYLEVSEKLTRKSLELTCYDLRAKLARGDQTVVNQGLGIWLTAQDLPSSCDPLFATLASMDLLTDGIRVARLRLALEAGNLPLARHLVSTLEPDNSADLALLDQASLAPEKVLAAEPTSQVQREINFYALSRLAQKDQAQAAQTWNARLSAFPEAEQRYGWGVVALASARQLNPQAVTWFLLAKDQLSDIQNVWMARTMLRAGRWLDVYRSIVSMPADMQDEAVWRYWKARALLAMKLPDRANLIFAKLSHEIHYYGLLANEELPESLENQPVDYRPSPEEVRQVNRLTGLKRALLLHSLELNTDAAAEWNWAIRGFDDHQLLAAAELARQNQWYDRAIQTAERTQSTHNMDLRYLTPYRDLADTYSEKNGLDPAWVYGLMRQESRFMDYARSNVGARGLMQIMPATGRWIAKLMGLGRKAHAEIADPDVNIKFGTFYLKRLLTSLDNSAVLATAGYNAGPGRARRWQASEPLEGAIYTESIPIPETREYVKKVLANAMYYSQRLGLRGNTLKERLGIIPAQATAPVASGATPGTDAGTGS
jgi:soluble lytic murein transglycosylase